jgi:hypothetical protein
LGDGLGLDLGAKTLHGLVVGGDLGELSKGALRGGEITGVTSPQGIGHETNFDVRGILRERLPQGHDRSQQGNGEHDERRRREGAIFHCGKVWIETNVLKCKGGKPIEIRD